MWGSAFAAILLIEGVMHAPPVYRRRWALTGARVALALAFVAFAASLLLDLDGNSDGFPFLAVLALALMVFFFCYNYIGNRRRARYPRSSAGNPQI